MDARKGNLEQARHSSEENLVSRSYMNTIQKPAVLVVEVLSVEDEGEYRCRVDFRKGRTRNSVVFLKIISKNSIELIYSFALNDFKLKRFQDEFNEWMIMLHWKFSFPFEKPSLKLKYHWYFVIDTKLSMELSMKCLNFIIEYITLTIEQYCNESMKWYSYWNDWEIHWKLNWWFEIVEKFKFKFTFPNNNGQFNFITSSKRILLSRKLNGKELHYFVRCLRRTKEQIEKRRMK